MMRPLRDSMRSASIPLVSQVSQYLQEPVIAWIISLYSDDRDEAYYESGGASAVTPSGFAAVISPDGSVDIPENRSFDSVEKYKKYIAEKRNIKS
jgi:hypothetical protein